MRHVAWRSAAALCPSSFKLLHLLQELGCAGCFSASVSSCGACVAACGPKASCTPVCVVQVLHNIHWWGLDALQHQLCDAIALVDCRFNQNTPQSSNNSSKCEHVSH